MTHPPHRAKLIRDALAPTNLPKGKPLARALAEALGEPKRREQWSQKIRPKPTRGILLEDYERVAELIGGRVAIVPKGGGYIEDPGDGMTPVLEEIRERTKAGRTTQVERFVETDAGVVREVQQLDRARAKLGEPMAYKGPLCDRCRKPESEHVGPKRTCP